MSQTTTAEDTRRIELLQRGAETEPADSMRKAMTCPHDNISLPSTSDPQTVCADCGQVLEPWEVLKILLQAIDTV